MRDEESGMIRLEPLENRNLLWESVWKPELERSGETVNS